MYFVTALPFIPVVWGEAGTDTSRQFFFCVITSLISLPSLPTISTPLYLSPSFSTPTKYFFRQSFRLSLLHSKRIHSSSTVGIRPLTSSAHTNRWFGPPGPVVLAHFAENFATVEISYVQSIRPTVVAEFLE